MDGTRDGNMLTRVWATDKLNVSTLLGDGCHPHSPWGTSGKRTLVNEKQKLSNFKECQVLLTPIVDPIVFAAKVPSDTTAVDAECAYIGVARVTKAESEPNSLSSPPSSQFDARYILSWRIFDGQWYLLLDPEDLRTADVSPKCRMGILQRRLAFSSARVSLDHPKTLTIMDLREWGVIFGQLTLDMQTVEWESSMEEDVFHEMVYQLQRHSAFWSYSKTTPTDLLDMLKSCRIDCGPPEISLLTVRQFYHRRLSEPVMQYRFNEPVSGVAFLDALRKLNPNSRPCDIAKLSAMVSSKNIAAHLNTFARTSVDDSTLSLSKLPLSYATPRPEPTFKSPPTYGPIPSDELPTSIVRVTAHIEGQLQTFDVFPFAVIARNDIATRHVVAKDINSSRFLAIFESECGDEEYVEGYEKQYEEEVKEEGEEGEEECDAANKGHEGDKVKDYEEKGDGVKWYEKSEHGRHVEQCDSSISHIKADITMEGTISNPDRHSEEVESVVSGSSDTSKDGSHTRDDGERIVAEDEDSFDQWHLPDKEFSAYPKEKWIHVAILGSDPWQPQWLSATSWTTKTPTFTRASRLTSAQSDTISTPPSLASTSSEETENGSLEAKPISKFVGT
ncbi:hypothetical protein LTR17_006107 [Elasticomyces elasticus]|nr:hypothetical protein LTR17_006107 [Elasticomyces elasticus]